MYEEERSGFAFKDIILRLLFIVLLIFIVIWLFPTKNYVKNLIDQKLGTSNNQVFNTNIETMKDAALAYYNGSRLPEEEGKTKKLTLGEMLNKNLLVEFTDSKGKKCDNKKSYVEVTKNKTDYSLKVNLACTDKTAYINSYIGSYEYCTSDVCEKKKLTENKEEQTSNNPEEQSSSSNSTGPETNNQCQYVKTTSGWTNYGNWSAWTTNKVSSSNSRQVQTKTEKVKTGTVVEQSGTYKHTQNSKKVTVIKNGTKQIVYVCPSDFDNGGSYNSFVTCVKTMPNYVTKNTYKNVTYYRYRDRTYKNNNNTYKWSSCNDSSLTSQGFVATGKTK